MLLHLLQLVLALFTLCGIAFYLLALRSTHAFRRRPAPTASGSPAVSILKPLKGSQSTSYEALRSHCVQQYGNYQIIFGVNDGTDDAIPVVRRLIEEFPSVDMRLVICTEVH